MVYLKRDRFWDVKQSDGTENTLMNWLDCSWGGSFSWKKLSLFENWCFETLVFNLKTSNHTVLKPTQVDRWNTPRLRENHVEGTRQITSVTSEKGGPWLWTHCFSWSGWSCFCCFSIEKQQKQDQPDFQTVSVSKVAQKRGWRLFTKNTRLCKMVTWRIGSDTCPVLEA